MDNVHTPKILSKQQAFHQGKNTNHYQLSTINSQLYKRYMYYCYLLGVFEKKKSYKVHVLLRDDLIKLDRISAEVGLMERQGIQTGEQLGEYLGGCENQIAVLIDERRKLRNQGRRVGVSPEKQTEIKSEIAGIANKLKELRLEIKLCDGIAERSGHIEKKLEQVQNYEKKKNKRRELELL